jgi:multidrug efflux system membrane fusion protein
VAQPVKVDVTEGTQVILASGLKAGDQVVIDGQEKLLPGSKVSLRTADATGGGKGASQAGDSEGAGAFGPGGAGPSEPANDPHKRGIETGSGVRPGGGHGPGATASTPDGQPHPHHRPGQTGQPQ